MKTANKAIRGLRQGKGAGGEEDNDEASFDHVLADIIGSTLANKMGKNDPEYKNFKEAFDHVKEYFVDRYTYISDELIHDVFTEIQTRQKDICNVVCKSMLDFCDLAEFFSACLTKTNPMVAAAGSLDGEDALEDNIFKLIVETFTQLGNAILNEDPQQTELFFLEYALEGILEIMCQNEFKRANLAVVLYTFCQNSSNAHLRVLRRIKQKICSTHKNQFVAIINDLMEYDEA